MTDWYEVYYNIIKGGALVTEIDRLHKLHGPVIRIGPNTVSRTTSPMIRELNHNTQLHFNDRHAYHDIYTYGSMLVKEPGFYLGFMSHATSGLVPTCDPQDAKERRSLLGPMFSRRAVLALETTVQEKVDQLIGLIEKQYTSPPSSIEMSKAYRSITIDVITEYCFAESANTITPNFDHPIQMSIKDTVKRLWIQRHFPFLNSLTSKAPRTFVQWLFPEFKSYLDMKAGYEYQIDGLLKDPDSLFNLDHETIYHHLFNPKNQMSLSRTTLVHEAFDLVGAGSDTIGNVCTVGTFHALKNQTIYRKVVEELREAWPDQNTSMGYVALEKLPYLSAFIKEALRYSVGIVHPLPRIVTASIDIGGHKIPPGTFVEMSTVFLHMNSDVFSDPYTFNPDRWLTEETSEMLLDLAPFSKGPRICIGLKYVLPHFLRCQNVRLIRYNLAWCELYLIFGNIFRKLAMTLLDAETEERVIFWQSFKSDYIAPKWHWEDYRVLVEKVSEASNVA
ncbi:cytochrome P450 [Lentinula aciculospora]|uniref:Cytochrome P450 n=1 Tax=Lentinula aciculospora TaxID=153920 RepID=A0A9W9DL75_9AGAR|nr:cytochrome P450 [Lentinula aciculospora]